VPGLREGVPQGLYALGFEGTTYYQSRNERLKDLAFEASTRVNFSELNAIYGFGPDTSLSHAMSVITQVADILYPQVDAGPAPTLVPVGVTRTRIYASRAVSRTGSGCSLSRTGGVTSVSGPKKPP